MEPIIWIVVVAVAAGVAWAMGSTRTRKRYSEALRELGRSLERGDASAGGRADDLPGIAAVREAAVAPEGPVGASTAQRGEPAPAPRVPAGGSSAPEGISSLDRIAGYLRGEVEAPLREAREEAGASLPVGVEDALVALEDLYFYLRPVPGDRAAEDLNELAREAGKEYRSEWDQAVEVHVPERRTTVEVDRDAILDALYLALHNAGLHGEGKDVEVVVRYQDGDCWLVVRDRGPGFAEEARAHALEPFFTTTDSRLGLGLYQIRKIVEEMDGTVAVRNRHGGGGQVEIVLPGRDD